MRFVIALVAVGGTPETDQSVTVVALAEVELTKYWTLVGPRLCTGWMDR